MTDSERLRQLRVTLGMSIRDLSTLAGIDRKAIERAERGEAVRPATAKRIEETLEQLAREVGLDAEAAHASLEMVIFGVLADLTSDMDWIDEVGAKLATALRASGLVR